MIIKNEQAMIDFGKKLSTTLKGGDILCLNGDLGAGKTCLSKGIALGLGITKEILSPTFTLMNIFPAPSALNKLRQASHKIKTLVHIDTYRLKNEQELIEIGAEDYLGNPNAICIIEWPEKITGLLKNKKIILVEIKHLDGGKREIFVKK